MGHKGNISDAANVVFFVNTIDDAVRVLQNRKIAVLTGAGISTDSGIPDYRGPGAAQRTPMSFEQFLESTESRKRYWAGSHLGWQRFSAAEPNPGHLALAHLESKGNVTGIITQNVDGLHRRAGSLRVVELHGSMDTVWCLDCGQRFSRSAIAHAIEKANPMLDSGAPINAHPDGDAEPPDWGDFVIPSCSNCGGTLKPDVVFFGELVPRSRFTFAFDLLHAAGALLIAGSSLAVNSGIRLLERATRRDIPVVILNRGETKGDNRATVRLEGGTSEMLAALAARL